MKRAIFTLLVCFRSWGLYVRKLYIYWEVSPGGYTAYCLEYYFDTTATPFYSFYWKRRTPFTKVDHLHKSLRVCKKLRHLLGIHCGKLGTNPNILHLKGLVYRSLLTSLDAVLFLADIDIRALTTLHFSEKSKQSNLSPESKIEIYYACNFFFQ